MIKLTILSFNDYKQVFLHRYCFTFLIQLTFQQLKNLKVEFLSNFARLGLRASSMRSRDRHAIAPATAGQQRGTKGLCLMSEMKPRFCQDPMQQRLYIDKTYAFYSYTASYVVLTQLVTTMVLQSEENFMVIND